MMMPARLSFGERLTDSMSFQMFHGGFDVGNE